jgi:methylated-DNA-[protein]-cysteine S-methyltransferase
MLGQEFIGYRPISSPFGPILLVWRQVAGAVRVVRIILPGEKRKPERILGDDFPQARQARSKTPPAVSRLAARLDRFLRGQPVMFSLAALDLEACTLFQQRVLPAEFRVPRGRVTTYGRLAQRIGAPGAARAVGNALAHNPFPLIIPCHRCVREDGRLGGFRGGQAMKRGLLEMEGIVFQADGLVPGRFFWPA